MNLTCIQRVRPLFGQAIPGFFNYYTLFGIQDLVYKFQLAYTFGHNMLVLLVVAARFEFVFQLHHLGNHV